MTDGAALGVSRPQLIFIAGSNGSGKSTLWTAIQESISGSSTFGRLAGLAYLPYLNVDDHFAAMKQTNQHATFSDATNWRNHEMSKLISEKKSFVAETVFDEGKLGYIKKARKAGFETTIHFMGVESPDLALERVLARVAAGGHNVDEGLVRKKWAEALSVADKSVTRADRVIFYDNSTDEGPRIVAAFENAKLTSLDNPPSWLSKMPSIAASISKGIGNIVLPAAERER